MGFLGKMVAKAVVKKAETAAMYGVVSHMENTRSVDALVNKSTANYMLFIKKKSMSIKRGFTVYDEFDKKKYVDDLYANGSRKQNYVKQSYLANYGEHINEDDFQVTSNKIRGKTIHKKES